MQLVNHVPGLKKTLEAFVFRVKVQCIALEGNLVVF